MPSNRRNLLAASGNGGASLYIEDVFSAYLYTGNGSTQTITNGIDLAGEGGLVWLKGRSFASAHFLFDTLRGTNNYLISMLPNAASTGSTNLTAFNGDGFSLSQAGGQSVNNSTETFVSWTFREQPKFFDIVTYTGTGSAHTIAHDLGSVPGMIIVKRTDTTGDWQVYHRSLTSAAYKLVLNSTAAEASDSTAWNSTAPTDAVFSVGTNATVNASGGTYVAYIFAHNAGGFGADGLEDIISCGSYTGNGSATGPVINLGFELQYLMVRRATGGTASWYLVDVMRGATASGANQLLRANLSDAESASTAFAINASGFQPVTTSTATNASGDTYIYIAIRRPMKTPEAGTEVFAVDITASASSPVFETGFPVDLAMARLASSPSNNNWSARLTGAQKLYSDSTSAEVASVVATFDYMNGWYTAPQSSWYSWMFKRAPGFMDVVCYTGTGVAHTEAHNLGVVPELMIFKNRVTAGSWLVYHTALGATKALRLETTNAESVSTTYWNDLAPTSDVFNLGTNSNNTSGNGIVAYLFATLAGVSKVGSYTGTGTTLAIDCGFAAGARFVMIKRTDSTGDWYFWDTARGIIAGNDPYLLLNSTAAEVTSTDYIDTASTGFEISSTAPAAINASGGSYIFLAIS